MQSEFLLGIVTTKSPGAFQSEEASTLNLLSAKIILTIIDSNAAVSCSPMDRCRVGTVAVVTECWFAKRRNPRENFRVKSKSQKVRRCCIRDDSDRGQENRKQKSTLLRNLCVHG